MKIKIVFIFVIIALLLIAPALYYINAIKTELDEARVHLATTKATNAALITADLLARNVTELQLSKEQQLREQADEQANELRKALSSSDCNAVRLPDSVLDRLR